MLNIKHTEAFDLAFRFVTETNLNIFLTGKAGTGKTTFLKYLRENCFKKMVVAAPTGVAAINAGGSTLHSLFQLPLGPFIPEPNSPSSMESGFGGEAVNSRSLLSKAHYSSEKLSLFRNLELLVIDEASMVACYTIDAVDTILRSVRRRHAEPFGGVQVLFIGDLHQLQPVVKNNEWTFLRDYYSSIFFFDSVVLRQHVPVMIELKEIFRQKDEAFVDILNEVRNNNLTEEKTDLLNTRLNRSFIPDDNDEYVILTTHNNQADQINRGKLQRLEAPSKKYTAAIHGDFPEHVYPAELNLELKQGAQVMFLRNDLEEKKYFNGKIGVITKLGDDLIKVKCKGEDWEIEVKKHEWKNMKYGLNSDTREITEEELGSFTQYPLRLAWAITIHKSQGLTFDKVIIDAANAFANGQVYVALSRCTSLEGLVLTSPINREYLGAHQVLKDWQQRNYDENSLEKRFHESRQQYVQKELQNIFTWKNWSSDLLELGKVIDEVRESLPAECFDWIDQLRSKQNELDSVACKFKDRIMQLCIQNSVVEDNQQLQQRIKDAANYFSAEISKWKDTLHNHSLSTDTKRTARKIDDALDEVNVTAHEILHKINYCKNGFDLNTYLKDGKKLSSIEVKSVQSSYAQSQKKNIVAKDSTHPVLYDRLAEMRRRIADETGHPLYMIFSNSAITNVCEALPGTTAALLEVKGFGKSKVKKYGEEVIEIVQDYCEENGLIANERLASNPSSKERGEKKTPTVDETIMLFKKNKSIEDVARERALAVSTIEGHLATAIKLNQIRIEELMPIEEAKKIAEYFPSPLTEPIHLSPVKEKIPADISYGKLKIVLAWMQSEKDS